MSDKQAVVSIWEREWSASRPNASATAHPYAQEAFIGLSRLIGTTPRSLLEVGCGTGRLCALLAKARPHAVVHGVDLAPSSVATATRLKAELGLPNMWVTRGDLFQLPYAADTFDVVFSEGVIQHFRTNGNPSCEASVREMLRVLRPGGVLVTGVVNWHCYPHTLYKWLLNWRGVPYEYGYERSYSRRELQRFLATEGLQDMDSVAYYASHAFHRLSKYWTGFGRLGRLVDGYAPAWLNNWCGFELLVKARKR